MMRPRPVAWMHRTVRLWWPFLTAVAAVCLVATSAFVTYTVVDERTYFEEEQDRDRRQDAALAELLRAQDGDAAEQAERLREAIAEVESLVADQFGRHDTNSATVHNDLLAQIAALLGRPAGVITDPVAARDVERPEPEPEPTRTPDDRRQPPTSSPPPPPADDTPPTTTTTTTQPGRSGLCERLPITPICRSPR